MPVELIADLRRRFRQADEILVLSGAGISAESGVPTYRGAGGLWKNFRAQDLATVEAFDRDPSLVWGWYRSRRRALLDCEPNAGHRVLAEAVAEGRELNVVTQNIDGLHGFAGLTEVLELHGDIWREKCVRCPYTVDRSADYLERRVDPYDDPPPECPECGDILRPDVVWFGEQLDPWILERAYHLAESCELMFVVGTSCEVHPAALLPLVARKAGAFVVEINIEPTVATDRCSVSLFEPAARALPRLFSE